MTSVDCTCDAGEADGGICGRCLGWGWYWEISQGELRDLMELTAKRTVLAMRAKAN